MTTYAKLLRAAETLKRVRAGLDSLAAGARTEEEREKLRRAAVQARVMYEGLERRIQRVLEQEPQHAGQAGTTAGDDARPRTQRDPDGEEGAAGTQPANGREAGRELVGTAAGRSQRRESGTGNARAGNNQAGNQSSEGNSGAR